MAGPPHDEALGASEAVVQVVDDARAYATAQVELYKAIATARLRAAKSGLILGGAAVFLLGSALTALFVGLILALSTLTGPLLATVIVVGVVLAIGAVLGMMAASRIGRAFGGGDA